MLKKLLLNKKLLLFLALINIVAGIYSLRYYSTQIETTSPVLWPFVPDSIIATLIFGITLFLLARKKLPSSLAALSIAGMWKYGLWTIFVLLVDARSFVEYWYFYVGHVFMVAETILIYKKVKIEPIHLAPALGFFIVNDLFDYFFGLNNLFNQSFFVETMFFAFGLTVLSLIIVQTRYSQEK